MAPVTRIISLSRTCLPSIERQACWLAWQSGRDIDLPANAGGCERFGARTTIVGIAIMIWARTFDGFRCLSHAGGLHRRAYDCDLHPVLHSGWDAQQT